ncbi:MAG: pyridoxal-dependent decarboxylase [Sphingomonadales bacterium]|jgi:aromatic-L-amino-acid decarboxylase
MSPLDIAIAEGRRFLDSLPDRPVGPTGGRAEMLAQLPTGLPARGLDPAAVVQMIARAAEPGLNCNNSPRFFAWVNGGALPAAQATDVLVSLWDQNAVLAATSPAAAVLEEVAERLVLEALGLPDTMAVSFTTGCQMSHAAALAAARHHVLAKAGWDVEVDGLSGAPRIRVIANAHRHGSVDRALRLIGLGTGCLVPIGGPQPGRAGVAELQAALAENPGVPTIVVLNAGDLNLGESDDFAALIPIAQAAGAWVHVDGAFGLWLAASPRFAHQVAGIGLADSIASDAHKWLNTPYDCGMAFVRHGAALAGAMQLTASYLSQGGDTRDPMNVTPEWSRRARSLPVLAALLELGRDGLADLISRCCDAALALHDGLAALDGASSVARPIMNQGMVRFHDRAGANISDAVIAAINASGEAFFSGTTWAGERTMRISVCNWKTHADDVARSVAAAARAAAQLR